MANQRLNAQIQIGGTVAKSLTKSLTDTRGQLRNVGRQIGQTTQRQRQLSREIQRAEEAGESVAGLRNEYNRLGRQLESLQRRQNVLRDMTNVGDRFGTMRREVGRFGKRATMVLGGVGASVFGVANSTANLGDEVAKTARQLGMGQTELQELQYAANRNGVENLEKNMDRFQSRLGDAIRGTGQARDALDDLGLSAQALEAMTPDEALSVLADEMQGLESQTQRLSVASDLFGAEGREMVRMLEDGSEGLDDMARQAHTTGYILSEEATKDAEDFKDSLGDMQMTMAGLKNIIGAELMPVVADSMDEMAGWLVGNRDKVEDFAGAFADKVEAAIPIVMDLASGIGTTATVMASATQTVAGLVGGFDNLGMIVAAVFGAKAIASVVMFGGSILRLGRSLTMLTGVLPVVAGGIRAIGVALAANPVGAIITGIAVAAGLIWKYWEPISGFMTDLWGGVQEVVSGAFDTFKSVFRWSPLGMIMRGFNAAREWLTSLDWSEMGKAVLGTLVDGIKSMAAAPFNAVKDALGSARDLLPFSDAKTGPLSDLTKSGASVPQTLAKGVDAGGDSLRDRMGNVVGSAMDATKGLLENKPVTQRVQQVLEPATSAAADLIPDPVRNLFGGGQEQETAQQAGAAQQQRNQGGAGGRSITINNDITLQVSRAEGEDEGSYIARLADRLMEELNDRQEGMLSNG